ncbi:MAG: methionine--tRNA ligase [Treponema sp.]|jgi:methionyl-tRNA synthetase|nr:methionine--tRNA ligase [Treponema sp.]
MKRRLITSALPYVNNVPHLGNLIQVLSADVFARFCRLRGRETLYICGTDEYGTATETKAAEEGVSPRELCDRYHGLHAGIYRWFHIGFDYFGRTSTPIQTEVTQGLYRKLEERGWIAEKTQEQLFCGSCGRFLADRYVRGVCPRCGYAEARGDQCEACGKLLDPTELNNSRCAVCDSPPRLESTSHLYLDLPGIKDRLEEWIGRASVRGAWARNAVQMTSAWIRDGLHQRAITRDLKWGIPVPRRGYENKVFYVWFDAPIGYISITGCLGESRGGDWRSFVDHWWKSPEETELFQFIGKDNIPFHTVIFPSTLLGSGENWTMLHHMSSPEYLNYEGGKFSKTRGVGVFGTDVMDTGIPPDLWRFYLFYHRPEKADSLFTWKDFQEKVNGELIGNLGNLVNRTLSFVGRYYGGRVPSGQEVSPLSWEEVRRIEGEICAKLEWAELRDAFHLIFELSSYANKVFQDAEPWRTRREDPPAAAALIRDLCLVVRDIAVLLEPYLPSSARRIAGFLGLSLNSDPGEEGGLRWEDLGRPELPGEAAGELLFAKLEDALMAELRDRYSGAQRDRETAAAAASAPGGGSPAGAGGADPGKAPPGSPGGAGKKAPLSSPEEIAAAFAATLDLRTARIVKVERHPNAEKLYIETVEIAGEEREIVSGIVPFYREEELLGKRIIVAYNLKAARLRGVVSRGMLLAAEDHEGPGGGERCEVLDAGDTPTGVRVILEGMEGTAGTELPPEITVDDFFRVPIRVTGHTVTAGGRALTVQGRPIQTAVVADAEVH